MRLSALLVFPLVLTPLDRGERLLLVKVVDENQRSIQFVCDPDARLGMWGISESWPAEPILAVLPARSTPEDSCVENTPLQGTLESDGRYAFRIAHARHYWGAVYGANVAFDPIRVEAPSVGRTLEIEVVARPAKLATLGFEFSTLPESGEVLTVEDAATGIVLHTATRRPFLGTVRLPASRYRVHVDDGPIYPWGASGEAIVRRTRGRMTIELDLQAGSKTDIAVEIPRGARLSLQVEGEWSAEDRARASEERDLGELFYEGPEPPARDEVAKVFLVPELGSAIRVEFAFPNELDSSLAYQLYDDVALGERQISEVVPTGEYTLVARLPAGRVVSTPIRLIAGDVAELVLRFPAR